MPTIYDIAKKAGVAPGTVSKVFNNYKQINEKTREKVLSVAKEMGYTPNITAKSLKTKQTFLIGVVFSEDVGIGLDHNFFSCVLENFRHRIGEYGYDTIFINNKLGNNPIGYLEHCKYRNVDGAFIITAVEDDLDMKKLIDSDIMCVTTDMQIEGIPCIMSDNRAGAQMAVEYLYANGHRRIGHIAGPLGTISAGERLEGYISGLKKVGLDYDSELMIEAEWFKYDAAYEAAIKYIDRYDKDTLPTGLFVCSDVMTLAVIAALDAKGLKVPEDVSVVGFDDIEIASLVTPKLTTIKQDVKIIGETIADTLYKLICKKDLPEELVRIPVELIERDSVRKID